MARQGERGDGRADLEETLSRTPYLHHADALFMHGRIMSAGLAEPTITWRSSERPRADHGAPEWLTASEFEDAPTAKERKVKALAALLLASKRTVLYTGAGISASVIGQAARSGQATAGRKGCNLQAQPTATHRALAQLGQMGLLHGWVQQNHDGLPQKAGYPQEKICEVHGSWFDPSNPVVKYSGTLKERECEWMVRESVDADFVLVLGTSLSGLYADCVATGCAARSLAGASLGAAMINLQQTPHDGKMTLRMFGTTDELLERLFAELALPWRVARPLAALESCVLVPYDSQGDRLTEQASLAGGGKRTWLE